MNEFLEKLLAYLELSYEEYEKLSAPVSVNDLPPVSSFFNFDAFIKRIEKAINGDEEVVIYGDYDADGILATSILKYAFLKRGKNVYTMIPSRYKDGYGLNKKVVDKLHKRGITLIITVDNGISAFDAIKHASALGIDVLVSDHHEISEKLPEATAILHPDLSTLGDLNSCGAYMALLISYGILGYYDDYLITLAGIATLADMMALVDRNRTVVRLAINNVNTNQYFPIVKLNGSSFFDETSLSMRIAPRINALGRLSQSYEANILIEYFTTSDPKRIYEISAYVEKVYEERKKMSKASELAAEELIYPAIIQVTNELEGVLGLIAQNYLMTYQKPALIFTESSEDSSLLKGSARSSSGFNVVEAFSYVKEFILASGGHPEAGGLTIKKEDYPLFHAKFNEFALLHPLKPKKEKYLAVSINEITPENFEIIAKIAPFGFKFPAPKIAITDANNLTLTPSRDNKHILHLLENGIKLVGFNLFAKLNPLEKYSLYGTFSRSEFKNKLSIDFRIIDIE